MTFHEVPDTSLSLASDVLRGLACHYRLRGGLNVLPCRPDEKHPCKNYAHYWETMMPSFHFNQLDWSGGKRIAALTGPSSGNLEVLDFDTWTFFKEFVHAHWSLVRQLPLVRTHRGAHIPYRCPEIEGNQVLARDNQENLLVETRGRRGVIVLPSPGQPYQLLRGDLCAIPTISPDHRSQLLAACRAYHRGKKESSAARSPATRHWTSEWLEGLGLEITKPFWPGDDFNRNGPDWAEILGPHGWELVATQGDVRKWKRPGKAHSGYSATTGYCKGCSGEELLAVFSSDAKPFRGANGRSSCTCYSKFAAFAHLNCNGDFQQASQVLNQQGFGAALGVLPRASHPNTEESFLII